MADRTILVPLTVGDGASVLVEVDSPTAVTRGGRAGVSAEGLEHAEATLEGALRRLGPTLKTLVSELRSAADRPDEVEVEMGLKLSADANLIIGRTGGEANFRVVLRWAEKSS